MLGIAALALATWAQAPSGRMIDVTEAIGLGPTVVPEIVPRVCFADLNRDDWPDVVVNRHRVFLNVADSSSPVGRRFQEIPAAQTGLQEPLGGTATVFADIDNDGMLDAVVSESCQPDDPKWQDHGRRTRWQRGKGDGTFYTAQALPTPPRPTIAIAVGDINRDGRLDLYFGNSYKAGDDTFEGFPGDLLLSDGKSGWKRVALPGDDVPFNEDTDVGARPTYGAMMASLDGKHTGILSLSYGRRMNRFWLPASEGAWLDLAPKLGIEADENRTGVYPDWFKEIAKTNPNYPQTNEKPFRSNGNNFDAAVGDVDGDGRLDLFLSDITHAWAGESSDRSRLLFQEADGRFRMRPGYNADHFNPKEQRWNQGDLFSELVDLDSDGDLDLIISSGDYPDQHLHLFLQTPGVGFVPADEVFSAQHDGSQQISLGDIDRDGDPDLIVGQTFFRLNEQQIAGRKPHLRFFANQMRPDPHSLVIRIKGDGKTVNPDALGAIVKAELPNGQKIQREIVGIGGHAGKQHDFVAFLGLGEATSVRRLDVAWPDRKNTTQTFRNLKAGYYELGFRGKLKAR